LSELFYCCDTHNLSAHELAQRIMQLAVSLA
jgi:hypothetical protein